MGWVFKVGLKGFCWGVFNVVEKECYDEIYEVVLYDSGCVYDDLMNFGIIDEFKIVILILIIGVKKDCVMVIKVVCKVGKKYVKVVIFGDYLEYFNYVYWIVDEFGIE